MEPYESSNRTLLTLEQSVLLSNNLYILMDNSALKSLDIALFNKACQKLTVGRNSLHMRNFVKRITSL